MSSALPVLLTGHDAKLCARRIHNDWDESIGRTDWATPADLQMRFDEGRAFEATVFKALKENLGQARYVDLSAKRGKANIIASTVEAMDSRAEVILGGWLPDDEAGGRTGRPDILLLHPEAGYVPGDVKSHRAVKASARGVLTYSLLGDPGHRINMSGLAAQTAERLDDHLQLAHYWRMLEACGRVPDTAPVGFIIGTDKVIDQAPFGLTLTWLSLAHRAFETFSRSMGSAKRSALERYDHEQGFRLKVAAVARDGGDALVQPIFTDECNSCPWFEHCRDIAGLDVASAKITSGRLSVREWKVLTTAGVVSVEQLADLDATDPDFLSAYLAEVTNVKGATARLDVAIRRAQMIREGKTLQRKTDGPISVPRADVEIDFDIEWDPDNHVYLWGALISRSGQSGHYVPIFSWDELDKTRELALATQFVTWLRRQIQAADAARESLLVYHYSHPEPQYLKQLLGEDAVADLLARFVDLLPIMREHFFGLHGLGIKKVAPAFGFNWRDQDPGGLQSQIWLLEARGSDDVAARLAGQQRILEYNEDDVRATVAIRLGLSSGMG